MVTKLRMGGPYVSIDTGKDMCLLIQYASFKAVYCFR